MSTIKISQLPAAASVSGTEELEVNQAGTSRKVTVQQIANLAGTSGVTSVNVSGGTTGLTASGGPVTSSGTITLAGTLALANGGTGATTQTGALTALGAVAKAGDTMTGALAVIAGTVSAPGLTFSGDTNTGIHSPAADTIAFIEGGVEAMRITAAGNVGIGNPNPSNKLDLYTNSAVTVGVNTGNSINTWASGVDSSGNYSFYSNGSYNIIFSNAGTERMRLDNAGQMRIGAGTVGAPALSVLTDTNTGVYFPAADTIAFAEGGVESLRLNSSGNAVFAGTAAMASSFLRNRIVNGDMRVDQRNNGASLTPADAQYTLDRWVAYRSQPSRFSVQQNAGAVTPPAGFTNYLGCTSLSAYSPVASDYFGLVQFVEGFNIADLGWGTASAQPITISFWVRSSLTGTFPVALRNSADNRGYLATYSIATANTWEFKSVTIPGDTAGTWLTNNGVGVRIWFDLGSGSSANGTAGAWGSSTPVRTSGSTNIVSTNGATFYLTGVQLEVGTAATPFERRQFGQELALCQRYCFRVDESFQFHWRGGTFAGTTYAPLYVAFPVQMRAAPTFLSGTAVFSSLYCTAFANYTTKTNHVTLIGLSNSANLDAYFFLAGGFIIWSAEL